MWKLSRRDYVIKKYAECGRFESLVDAARHIYQLEGKAELIEFRIYVDATGQFDDLIKDDNSDASHLSNLIYRSTTHFYRLDRIVS